MNTIIEQRTDTGHISVYGDESGLWIEVMDGKVGTELRISADQLWTLKNKIVLNDHALQAADKPKVGT